MSYPDKDDTSTIPWSQKLAYSFPAMSLAVIGIPVYVFLPKFYTDTMGLSISLVGLLLMAVRLFDAITDPLIGYISDRTQTAFGRRRPFIALGTLGLAIAIYFLFKPPIITETGLALYFGFWLFALFFFWTLVTIPYESMGPEMTSNYHERTVLFSVRDGFLILGTLIAAASPVLIKNIVTGFGQMITDQRQFSIMAYMYIPMILLSSLLCIYMIKEKTVKSSQDNLFEGFSTLFKNKPFVILISAYTISAIGSNLPATLILYYVEYVLQSQHAEGFLLIYFVTGILFLPAWIMASKKMGKKEAWILSMLINTLAFMGVFFLGPGDTVKYGVLVFISGIGFGAGLAIPSSIQADVIDYDELLTGKRREGRYIGLWSIAKKLSAALGIGVGLLLLGNSGYQPNVIQDKATINMIRVLYALVPCAFNLLAIGIISYYPLSEERYKEIRQRIRSDKFAKQTN